VPLTSEPLPPGPVALTNLRAVVLDIEGTTCPVDFVTGVLFPHAVEALPTWLQLRQGSPALEPLRQQLLQAWHDETDPTAPPAPVDDGGTTDLLPWLRWLIAHDRKLTALKDLQGMIWADGYADGQLQAPLFDDVAPALRRWHGAGLQLAVYSSGSVPAQQLLYGHSSAGDLRPLFSGWYDTRLGPKQESASYQRLVESLGCRPGEVLFLSDARGELAAGAGAGLQVCGCRRPGNPDPLADGPWPVVETLATLALTPAAA